MTTDISKPLRDSVRELAARVLTKQKQCAFTPPCKDCQLMSINAEWLATLIDRFEANVVANDKLLIRLRFA